MSSEERTGWRDQELSARHRLWGVDCPMADIDGLLSEGDLIDGSESWLAYEYDLLYPKALVEWKQWQAAWPPKLNANLLSLGILGDLAQLPVFVIRYGGAERNWRDWWVAPINNIAAQRLFCAKKAYFTLEKPMKLEKELLFVNFLYWIRGRTKGAPDEVAQRINGSEHTTGTLKETGPDYDTGDSDIAA